MTVLLASWTLVYHVSLLARLDVTRAVLMEAVLLAVTVAGRWWVVRRSYDVEVSRGRVEAVKAPEEPEPTNHPGGAPPRVLVALAGAVLSGAAACAMALSAPWPAVVVLWLLAALAGTAWAFLRLPRDDPVGPAWVRPEPDGGPVALVWGFVLAALSLLTLKSNPDDLYYVNLSQWVVDHGTFPVRDTIFSDQVFPAASWPPVASYDPLVGTLARLLHVHAGSVAYVLVPPVATMLAVLALWRLLRAWRVLHVAVALSVALVFVLVDVGGEYATPGDLFVNRIWQGKVILLCVLVPLLLVYAVRYVERPTSARAAWLAAGGIAAVGLSTTALFIVPLLALAGAAPLVRSRPSRALLGAAAMAGYPLLAGVTTVVVGGHSADDFGARRLYRFEPSWFGHQIFLDGILALVGVGAVLGGAFLVPHPAARLTTALLALLTGLSFVPGLTHLTYQLLGLGPTLWRVSWVLSIVALVGVLGSAPLRSVPLGSDPVRADPTPDLPRRAVLGRQVRWTAPALLVLLVVGAGTPVWSESAGTVIAAPGHWQRGAASLQVARRLSAVLEPGDVVLAPSGLSISVDVLTTRIKVVAPRKYVMDYLSGHPAFHYIARARLMDYVEPPRGGYVDPARVLRALRTVDVTAACVETDDQDRLGLLRAHGFHPLIETGAYVCVRR